MIETVNISVVIPTCDRQQLLLQTIKSVNVQTYKPYEVIIVNNGRQDVDLSSVKGLDLRIYNIIPYAGVAQARNFGAIMAEGEFIAFLDDDDLWCTTYLMEVAKAISGGEECIVSRLDQLVGDRILPFKNAYGKINLKDIFTYNPGITGSNVVISKELFFDLGGYDPKLPPSEDKSLLIELCRRGFNAKVLQDNQAILRQHDQTNRLTGASKMSEGIFQFTRKYYKEMTIAQRFINYGKIIQYKRMYGSISSRFFYASIYFFINPCSYLLRRLFK